MNGMIVMVEKFMRKGPLSNNILDVIIEHPSLSKNQDIHKIVSTQLLGLVHSYL